MKRTIGFYKFERTALSVSMRLMDEFSTIKLSRIKNNGSNPGFPVDDYPFMLNLISGAKVIACKKIHAEHFAKMKSDKRYKAKYDLSNSYYR